MLFVLTLDQQNLRTGMLEDLKRRTCTWLHLEAPTEEEFKPILAHVGITKELADELLSKKQRPALRDDLVQLTELETTYRDILTSTLEVYLTTISNALNFTMKRLSGWGAIILVPSLVAGIFGMNFEIIPTTKDPHGFAGALAIMLFATASLYWYFKKRDWI